MTKQKKATNGTKNSTSSAIDYIRSIRPNMFKRLEKTTSFDGETEIEIYGPRRLQGYDQDDDRRMGDAVQQGDIHIIVRYPHLNAGQIRALPVLDFDIPQIIGVQVNHFFYNRLIRGGSTEQQIDKSFIESLVRDNPKLRGLNLLLMDGVDNGETRKSLPSYNNLTRFFYQIISFPLTKGHVEGLLNVAESFYDPTRERENCFNELDKERGELERRFLLRHKLSTDEKKWKRVFGDTVAVINDGQDRGADMPINDFKTHIN